MTDWIDRPEALARLGVKPQTLYAYVSRDRIEVRPNPARPGSSQYKASDVDALVARKAQGKRPQAIASASLSWGEPSIPTCLSTVVRGQLIYRGRDAVAFARSATLEEAAALLWASPDPVCFDLADDPARSPFEALALMANSAPPVYGRSSKRLARDAADVVAALAVALGVRPGSASIHEGLGAFWGLDDAQADHLRQALVLMADHDLNASTFACRVAASTGASMAASLLAGLCALSGPVHGGASAALAMLLRECEAQGAELAVSQWLDRHGQLPGFGHPLYPDGDVRALALLEQTERDDGLKRLEEAVFAQAGHRPNIDFALTALARTRALPEDAPYAIFVLGRSVGWAAHVIEQAETRRLIRPRGLYQGEVPPRQA